jgi:hypothetical protein
MSDDSRISSIVPARLKAEIERRAEGNRSQGEVIRNLLWSGLEAEKLRDRLETREDRIDQLEEQLAKRSQVEEKVDVLAKRVEDREQAADAPFPVRWWRWFRNRGDGGSA